MDETFHWRRCYNCHATIPTSNFTTDKWTCDDCCAGAPPTDPPLRTLWPDGQAPAVRADSPVDTPSPSQAPATVQTPSARSVPSPSPLQGETFSHDDCQPKEQDDVAQHAFRLQRLEEETRCSSPVWCRAAKGYHCRRLLEVNGG